MFLANVIFVAVSLGPGVSISWKDNYLTIDKPNLPSGAIRVLYLEAYCRSGSTNRDWKQTVIPHRTELISAEPPTNSQTIKLRCKVEPSVIVDHEIKAGLDDVDFRLTCTNTGKEFVDVQWAQPCMRVDKLTGLKQADYFTKCFIYRDDEPVLLHQTKRTDKALYIPGQVYVPANVDRADVNPRPLSPEVPKHQIIGAYSADGQWIVAMAWDQTQELFQGVITCIHSDFRIGGLKPGETKKLHGKVYLMRGTAKDLLARYKMDFPTR